MQGKFKWKGGFRITNIFGSGHEWVGLRTKIFCQENPESISDSESLRNNRKPSNIQFFICIICHFEFCTRFLNPGYCNFISLSARIDREPMKKTDVNRKILEFWKTKRNFIRKIHQLTELKKVLKSELVGWPELNIFDFVLRNNTFCQIAEIKKSTWNF